MFEYNKNILFCLFFILFLNICISITVFAVSPAPLDGDDKPVDWWAILKMPLLNTNDLSCDGTTYYFASNKFSTPVYQLKSDNATPKSLNDIQGNPIAQTLQCMFDAMNKHGNVSYIVYNDEKPEVSDGMLDFSVSPETDIAGAEQPGIMYPDGKTPPNYSQYGHLKGMLVWDKDYGYWLIHSAPKFAFNLQSLGHYSYKYPQNAVVKGQSFICFGFETEKYLKTIANQLLYNKPLVIQSYIAKNSDSESWYNNINQIITKKWNKDAPDIFSEMTLTNLATGSSIEEIYTVGGVKLISFAKNSYWNNDLYSYSIGPALGVSLYVETWRNGYTLVNFYKDTDPKAYNDKKLVDISIWKKNDPNGSIRSGSYVLRYSTLKYPDPKYDTINVETIRIDDQFEYKYTKDHSKWAISQSSGKPWVFIGDMNRQGPHSQWIRGGGGIAMENKELWTFFNRIISKTEPPAKMSQNIEEL